MSPLIEEEYKQNRFLTHSGSVSTLPMFHVWARSGVALPDGRILILPVKLLESGKRRARLTLVTLRLIAVL